MVRGTAVLREGLNCSREAARTSVSGIWSLMNLKGKRFLRRDSRRQPFHAVK